MTSYAKEADPDLLADVFPDTLDAPMPALHICRCGCGKVLGIVPDPADRRWAPKMADELTEV